MDRCAGKESDVVTHFRRIEPRGVCACRSELNRHMEIDSALPRVAPYGLRHRIKAASVRMQFAFVFELSSEILASVEFRGWVEV